MKSSLDQLSPKDREALALWYDTASYKALRKLVDVERVGLAKDHVDQVDILQIRHLSGQVSALKKLILTVKQNYKNSKKNEEKNQEH